jgi:LuxR family transcriptional regulator, maltose regulon positive regulatory protein
MSGNLSLERLAEHPVAAIHPERVTAFEGGSPALSLLASKVAVADLPAGMVARQRLVELLSAGVQGRLTLVAAPAGFGKTVLLASWMARARPDGRVAWVSLDADDNDPGRFWSYVVAALERSGAIAADSAPDLLLAPTTGSREFQLPLLINCLAGLEAPVVLVLDDFHEITDPAVLRSLELLVRHAPPQLRLVIATRADPQLPLPRLRTSGLLAEIRAAELAFTPDEAAELLASEGLELARDELVRLHHRAEGWAAGLRLAALSMRRQPDPGRLIARFAGDDRGVAGYFIGEVLDRQSPEVRAVLLRTAVLDRMTGSLVNALTGRSDGDRVLAELERTNAFVVSLGQRSWYRYHQLFAELLRVELRYQAPEELPELHRRAAGWCAANGFAVEAARHAIASGDWQLATTVLLGHWNDLVRDDPFVLRELLALLPPELARTDPELALVAAVDRASGARPGDPPADEGRRSVPLLLAAFQLGEAWQANDVAEISVAALKMLALLGDPGPAATEDDDVRVFAMCALVEAQRCSGDLEAAGATLHEALAAAKRAGLERSRLDCLSQLAVLEADCGRLRAAFRAAHQALELAERHDWSATPQAARAHLALTMVHGHRNQLGVAKDHLDRVIAISSNAAPPLLMDGVSIVHAWLNLVRGDIAAGWALAAGIRRHLACWRAPAFTERSLTVIEAGLHAARGDLRAARALLAGPDESSPRTAELAVGLAAVELADGEPAAAAATLAPYLNGQASVRSLALLTTACLLDALAADALYDEDRASRSLERALVLAGQEGFRLPFIALGEGVPALLISELDRDTAHRLLVAELLETLEVPQGPTWPDRALDPLVLVDPLSERERVVLRYLGGVLSNVEIASELCVSVNTVKTHVKGIYRKLGVSGRRQAIRRGRELHLF